MTAQQPGNGIELAHAAHMPAPQGGALPTGLEWQALERMAGTLASSSLVPYQLRGKPGDVAVILLAAREYGVPPLMALNKLPVVNGKPAPMGELMVALVLRAGHSIRADFKAPDGTRYTGGPLTREHYGEAIVRRRDWPAGVEESLTFTLAEGIAAGLLTIDREGNPHAEDQKGRPTPWQLYTPNMARWRAVANVCRLYFPDVLMGLSYLPEELGAVVDEDGAPVVGEVVEDRRTPAPGGSIEERTAQEAADRLADFNGPVEVLDNVEQHARANGYLTASVTYAGDVMPLESAIDVRREWLKAIVDVESSEEEPVDAELVEPSPESPEHHDNHRPNGADCHDGCPPQEPANAPQEAEQPVPDAEPTPAGETPQEAAYDLAREALHTGDKSLLLTIYNGLDVELGNIDVLPVVDDADLATLGAPGDLDSLRLGALVMAAGRYVAEHGIAVRDPQPAPRTAEQQIADTPDPWADGSGMAGSPDQQA